MLYYISHYISLTTFRLRYFRSISNRFCTQSDIANQLPDYLRLRTSRPTNDRGRAESRDVDAKRRI